MKKLLILEDDFLFIEAIKSEFIDRGYAVYAESSLDAIKAKREINPDFAIVDLKLRCESGLDAVSYLKTQHPLCAIVVLTGYGSIATAVQAIKLGAANYIAKPASIDEIEQAFTGVSSKNIEAGEHHSLSRHEREYIELILQEFDGNISKTAKALGIHRQSLQRKLRKFSPNECKPNF